MNSQERIFINSLFFVLGFTLVFSVVGILLQTIFAHQNIVAMSTLRIIGGMIITVFGIAMILSAKYFIPFFGGSYKLKPVKIGNRYASSFLFGLAFAIGWTPCVGPILGAIYVLALTSPGVGFLLLLAYSLGLGIPFLIAGAFISRLTSFMSRIRGFMIYFNAISGILLIAMGLLVITGYIGLLSVFLIGNGGSGMLSDQLNFLIAILAGVITFLSPCILPLLPAYISYMAGTAATGVKDEA